MSYINSSAKSAREIIRECLEANEAACDGKGTLTLAAMQARAEKAEREAYPTARLVKRLPGTRENELTAKVAALEADLRELRAVMADQDPVVLAATQLVTDDSEYVRSILGNAVRTMLAARSLRGVGEGDGA